MAVSSNGKTPVSKTGNGGSVPPTATIFQKTKRGYVTMEDLITVKGLIKTEKNIDIGIWWKIYLIYGIIFYTVIIKMLMLGLPLAILNIYFFKHDVNIQNNIYLILFTIMVIAEENLDYLYKTNIDLFNLKSIITLLLLLFSISCDINSYLLLGLIYILTMVINYDFDLFTGKESYKEGLKRIIKRKLNIDDGDYNGKK